MPTKYLKTRVKKRAQTRPGASPDLFPYLRTLLTRQVMTSKESTQLTDPAAGLAVHLTWVVGWTEGWLIRSSIVFIRQLVDGMDCQLVGRSTKMWHGIGQLVRQLVGWLVGWLSNHMVFQLG